MEISEVIEPCNKPIGYVLNVDNLPRDYIFNGFSIKETILSVIEKYNNGYRMDLPECELLNLATEITDALAVKLRLKQGDNNGNR